MSDPDAALHSAVPGKYAPPGVAPPPTRMPSIAATPTLDELAYQSPVTQAAVPPLSFFDRVKLGYKEDQARPSWGFNETNWKNGAIVEINDALRKKGVQPAVDLMNVGDAIGRTIRPGETYEKAEARIYGEVLAQVDHERLTDPNFLPDYAGVADKASFDKLVSGRQRQQLDDVQRQAPDGLGLAGFAGGLAHGSLDPINYIPIGGEAVQGVSVGSRILRNGLRWGAFNVGVTAVTEPLVREHANQLGIDRTNSDFAVDLLGAGTLGFILGGPGAELGRFGKDKLVEALKARRAPAPDEPHTPFESFDANVAKTFSELVPEEQRTPDEKAALHAIERDAEVKATSPFAPGPAGEDAHVTALDRGMAAITGAPEAPRAVKPVARERVAGPDDVEGARMPARELLKAKINHAEAPNGGYNLLGSGALGPYQFMPRTWVNLFKRRYPKDTRSFDQIAALRTDPHLNDVLINDLISENGAALQHAGFDANAGNLYLAHVLGHDRAVRVLRAGAEETLGALLPHDYFGKNPFKATDSAASLIRWAYGKMGEKGIPEHIAAAPEGVDAAAATEQGVVGPEVDIPTGEHVVEALFGDVALTDRPILRPELFASPEDHAAAQVRFEREADMAEGYAPVMSRADAFSPREHFDALKAYRGKVTPEAIGDALGISPTEVKRAVGAMQAIDPKSPFVLTRGRAPKFDKLGNVTREGTEPGRVIRRPQTPVKANETLLEFLSKNGGLQDTGGELKGMDAHLWHRGGPFRRQLIQEHGMQLDDAFEAAISADYFPEHSAGADTYADLPDPATFLEAIDEELRGNPRHRIGDVVDAAEAAYRARFDPEGEAAIEQHFLPRKMTLEEIDSHVSYGDYEQASTRAQERGLDLDDNVLVEAAQRWSAGHELNEAIDDAVMSAAVRDLEDFAALAEEIGYDVSDEWQGYTGAHAEIRDGEPVDPADTAGERGSAPATGGESAGRAALEAAANDPKAGQFADPVGVAAEGQADSTIHDAEMAVTADDGARYRLEEDGEESDLASILDEINEAQKAATEMRNCLKPNGGDK